MGNLRPRRRSRKTRQLFPTEVRYDRNDFSVGRVDELNDNVANGNSVNICSRVMRPGGMEASIPPVLMIPDAAFEEEGELEEEIHASRITCPEPPRHIPQSGPQHSLIFFTSSASCVVKVFVSSDGEEMR
jgi:hypothetical protein